MILLCLMFRIKRFQVAGNKYENFLKLHPAVHDLHSRHDFDLWPRRSTFTLKRRHWFVFNNTSSKCGEPVYEINLDSMQRYGSYRADTILTSIFSHDTSSCGEFVCEISWYSTQRYRSYKADTKWPLTLYRNRDLENLDNYFFRMTHRQVAGNSCAKFLEIACSGIWVTEQTSFWPLPLAFDLYLEKVALIFIHITPL